MEIKTYEKLTLTFEEMAILEKSIDIIENIEFLTRTILKENNFASYSDNVLNILDTYVDRVKEMCEIE